MRLKQITIPYLKSNLKVKEFAKKVNLSPCHVSVLIRKDLEQVYQKLNNQTIEIKKTPRNQHNRNLWLKKINQLNKIN